MVKKIKLTKGKYTKVDDEDFEWVNKWKWCAEHGKNKTMYALRNKYIGKINGKPKWHKIRLHRLIMGAKNGEMVDHINGDGLDNRRCNLRIVTHRQNCQNLHIHKSSEYPGVSWNSSKQKWAAHIRINARTKFLGYFVSEIQAFNAYKKAVHDVGDSVVCELKE